MKLGVVEITFGWSWMRKSYFARVAVIVLEWHRWVFKQEIYFAILMFSVCVSWPYQPRSEKGLDYRRRGFE